MVFPVCIGLDYVDGHDCVDTDVHATINMFYELGGRFGAKGARAFEHL